MWYVVKGKCMVNEDLLEPLSDAYNIPVETWHRGHNPFDEPTESPAFPHSVVGAGGHHIV